MLRRSFPSPVIPVIQSSGAVSAALTVEYLDSSGDIQEATIVDGVTSISGTAPFPMAFDATASRSPGASAADLAGAWNNLGYRLNYGESIGGTWVYPTNDPENKDEDTGPPIFGHVFTQAGTHTVRLRVRNSNGDENTISFTVVISAPSSPTNIPTTDTVWPTWASNTYYTLDAGADYTSFGNISFGDLHNIIIRKTGAGADPIISGVTPDNRGIVGGASITPARGMRFEDIDVDGIDYTESGGRYFAFVGGRVRTVNPSPVQFQYDSATSSDAERANVRYGYGLFLYDTGEMNSSSSGTGYVLEQALAKLHMKGVLLNKDAGTSGSHIYRQTNRYSSFRHCNFWITAASGTYLRAQSTGDEAWITSPIDAVGDGTVGGLANVLSEFNVGQQNQYNRSGGTLPTISIQIMLGEPGAFDERHNFYAVEDCYFFGTTIASSGSLTDLDGSNLSLRNIRADLGDGDYITYRTGNGSPTYDGPYLTEDVNTRPVPSAF